MQIQINYRECTVLITIVLTTLLHTVSDAITKMSLKTEYFFHFMKFIICILTYSKIYFKAHNDNNDGNLDLDS